MGTSFFKSDSDTYQEIKCKKGSINDQDFTPLACHRMVQTFLVKNIKTDMKKEALDH